jgi:phage shock protein C
MTDKKLFRSRNNRKIAGVCGGLGDYFNIDPTLVRILFLIFLLFGGGGFLLYIICWIAVPEEMY